MAASASMTNAPESKRLENLGNVTSIAISKHLTGCGRKEIGAKGYKFFVESYIHNVFTRTESEECVLVKGRCHRSQRKNEAAHFVEVNFKKGTDNISTVVKASCSCKAGSGGHCNHVFAMLYQLNHWCMLGLKEIPADLTCTSMPQAWHKPRGSSIEPDPIMKCTFVKSATDRDGNRKMDPVKCKLYDPRAGPLNKWDNASVLKMAKTLECEDRQAPFSYLLKDQEYSETISTALGDMPLGSTLGHQLNETSVKTTKVIIYMPQNSILDSSQHRTDHPVFPKIPIVASCAPFNLPQVNKDNVILTKIKVNKEFSWELERNTVCQSRDPRWVEERKMRLTASNFGKVIFRKQQPSDAFLKSIFDSKDLSKVPSVSHGKSHEAGAREKYSKKMQKKIHKNVTVFDCGLVVNPSCPYLGATPDGKVYDPTSQSPFGLLEIKCPYTCRNMSIEEACQHPNFQCTMVDGVPRLKKDGKSGYYAQVQGQLALSGLDWCDFVVYLTGSRYLSVERIYFDSIYWNDTLLPKLSSFYFTSALPYLVKKYG